jgi:hypothetical protein
VAWNYPSLLKGHGPIEGDNKLMRELYASGQARAFLENHQSSKKTGPESKVLSLAEIEEKLERIIQVHGEDRINQLRNEAKKIAGLLHLDSELAKLNRMINALLTAHPSKIPTSALARARTLGTPYDADRIKLFEILFAALHQREFASHPDKNVSERSFRNFAFFEAYFAIQQCRRQILIFKTGKPQ